MYCGPSPEYDAFIIEEDDETEAYNIMDNFKAAYANKCAHGPGSAVFQMFVVFKDACSASSLKGLYAISHRCEGKAGAHVHTILKSKRRMRQAVELQPNDPCAGCMITGTYCMA